MRSVQNFKDLEVWKRGRKLVKDIYLLTQTFPREQQYILTNQLLRSAISIPSNIAEGHSRHGLKDYIHFVSIAIGSLAESETQVLLAEDLGFTASANTAAVLKDIEEMQRMMHALRSSLKAKLPLNS